MPISKLTLALSRPGQCWPDCPSKVPNWLELDRKCTIFPAYKPCLKILLALLCMQIKPFKYQV